MKVCRTLGAMLFEISDTEDQADLFMQVKE
jgi:hypothetical protein